MQVILLERVEKLGFMGDVVTVKPGYARNYLLPQKKALRATESNIAYFKNQKAQLEAVNLKRRDEAEKVAKRMDKLVVKIIRQASETGQLYGSVRSQDVAEAMIAEGVSVNRSQVSLLSPIKTIGAHKAYVRLHPEVSVEISVKVAQSEEQANLMNEDVHGEVSAPAESTEA